jgi:hypothetical protein
MDRRERDFRLGADLDRPLRAQRAQLIVAVVLGAALVLIPVLLLGRARTIGAPIVPGPESSANANADFVDPGVLVEEDAGGPTVVISDARMLSCHDPGPKKTAPEQCDKPDALDAALKSAIKDGASCATAGGGTIVYALDLTIARKKGAIVTTPKEGRTMKNARVVQKCAEHVKDKLDQTSLDGAKHEHARYRLSIIATYPGAVL